VKDTNQRWAVLETVAERILALPSAILRARASVVSWVRMVPSLGRVTVVPEQRITPPLTSASTASRPRPTTS
jgi:hypothetical protein